jgi:acetyl/propionyl-CoA carboxylase alpha subunit
MGMCCIYSKENAASSVVTKVIEEAPSSVLTWKHLKKMGEAAV